MCLLPVNSDDDVQRNKYKGLKRTERCFKRSALSLKWTKGTTYGNISYLSQPDLKL